jgi:hypothetical protein
MIIRDRETMNALISISEAINYFLIVYGFIVEKAWGTDINVVLIIYCVVTFIYSYFQKANNLYLIFQLLVAVGLVKYLFF